MAHLLTVSDGTTTVDLNSGTAMVLSYFPETPTRTDDLNASLTDTPAVVLFTTRAAARAAEASLNRLFQEAREYRRSGVGARVFVNFRPDGDSDTYRSELYDEDDGDVGRVEHGSATLDWQWFNQKLVLTITWERRIYWEGPRTPLSMSNSNGSGTGALAIYNHNDAGVGHDNYAQIASVSIKGDLPTPLELKMVNTYNSGTRVGLITVSHNWRSDPANVNLIIEGESATAGSGSNVAEAGSSGGFYRSIPAPSSETLIAEFPLSGALLAQLAGNRFRIQARFGASPISSYIRAEVRLAGLSTLWGANAQWRRLDNSGELVTIADGVPLPPYQIGSSSLGEISLALYARGAAGGAYFLDFLQLSPLDSWREYRDAGYGLPYTASLTDDPIEGRLYANFGSGELGNYVAYGDPIMLWPNRLQRIYLLWRAGTGSADPERTMTLQGWYRPRRTGLATE